LITICLILTIIATENLNKFDLGIMFSITIKLTDWSAVCWRRCSCCRKACSRQRQIRMAKCIYI